MSSSHDLASRVQALEDIEAIKRLKARWWFACDTRDLAGMRACYDEDDFLIDFGFIGEFTDMDAFIEVFESLACHPTHVDMHHGTAPEIEMTGLIRPRDVGACVFSCSRPKTGKCSS